MGVNIFQRIFPEITQKLLSKFLSRYFFRKLLKTCPWNLQICHQELLRDFFGISFKDSFKNTSIFCFNVSKFFQVFVQYPTRYFWGNWRSIKKTTLVWISANMMNESLKEALGIPFGRTADGISAGLSREFLKVSGTTIAWIYKKMSKKISEKFLKQSQKKVLKNFLMKYLETFLGKPRETYMVEFHDFF